MCRAVDVYPSTCRWHKNNSNLRCSLGNVLLLFWFYRDQIAMSLQKPYNGDCRKFVVAFDIGMTYSGVSYSFLEPGHIPEVKCVDRYDPLTLVDASHYRFLSDSRPWNGVGTIARFRRYCIMTKTRPSALLVPKPCKQTSLREPRTKNGTKSSGKIMIYTMTQRHKCLTFSTITRLKHHLQSEEEDFAHSFAEFLRYLRQCTETYFCYNHADGQDLWESFRDCTEYVLTHPSGWETAQYKLRRSAVLAGLIPDSEEGYQHIHFVNEDEACLNFCVRNHLIDEIEVYNFLHCDCCVYC